MSGSFSLNIVTTPFVSRMAVCTSPRCGKPWRRAVARNSLSEVPLERSALRIGFPSSISIVGEPSSRREAKGQTAVVRAKISLIRNRVAAPSSAPVTDRSLPMIPF